jgi:hypothetical protein
MLASTARFWGSCHDEGGHRELDLWHPSKQHQFVVPKIRNERLFVYTYCPWLIVACNLRVEELFAFCSL